MIKDALFSILYEVDQIKEAINNINQYTMYFVDNKEFDEAHTKLIEAFYDFREQCHNCMKGGK